MAVANVSTTSDVNQHAATTTTSGSFGLTSVGGATHVLALMVMHPADPGTYGTMTFGGASLTKVGSTLGNSTFGFISVWKLINPGASGSFSLTWANSVVYALWAAEFSGINTTTPLVVTSGTGNSASPALSVTTVSGDAAMAAMVTPTATHNIGSINQTGFFDAEVPINTAGHYGLASGSSVAFSSSLFGAENYLYVGAQVQQSGGAVRTPSLTLMGVG